MLIGVPNGQTGSYGALELGATWLHGVDGHPVYDLAVQNGLMTGQERKNASTSPRCSLSSDHRQSFVSRLEGKADSCLQGGSGVCPSMCARELMLWMQTQRKQQPWYLKSMPQPLTRPRSLGGSLREASASTCARNGLRHVILTSICHAQL